MDYPTLLKNAPPHDSDEFLDYLKEHNEVVFEDTFWLVIKNVKYHTEEKPWYTAFTNELSEKYPSFLLTSGLLKRFGEYEWRKKSAKKQTVKRFHFHIIGN